MLFVEEYTEHACLRAYRNGSFYGCLFGEGPFVARFSASESLVSVELSGTAEIRFVADGAVAKILSAEAASFEVPQTDGKPDVGYIRVEASHESGERLFLQPVLYS